MAANLLKECYQNNKEQYGAGLTATWTVNCSETAADIYKPDLKERSSQVELHCNILLHFYIFFYVISRVKLECF